MSPTQKEIKKCKQILAEISDDIPARGYTGMVKEVFDRQGLPSPPNRKIYAVRQGKEYSLAIAKALQEISQPRDENDELIEPPKWEVNPQTNLKLTAHRSRGKKKIPA